jgi:hypothetical protein
VTIAEDGAPGEKILEIEVRDKQGVGYCKSMPGAVRPFERLKARNNPKPTDPIFPKTHRDLFNTILEEEKLKFDRENQQRTAYSLRHTYICLRLLEGADIYQIAKNCRTSVEMIEKFYASHIKTNLDAAAINIMRKKKFSRAKREEKRLRKALIRLDFPAVKSYKKNGNASVAEWQTQWTQTNLSACTGNRRSRTAQSRGNL